MKVSFVESAASFLFALVALTAAPQAQSASVTPQQQVARYRRDSSSAAAALVSGDDLVRLKRQAQTPKKRKIATNGDKPQRQQISTKAFEAECLAAHNKWRQLHQAGPLEFDQKIQAFAQKRADFIAASDGDEFKHPDDLPYGENLAWHSRSTHTCAELIKMWYDEVDMYNFKLGAFSHETGHFTQLVWKGTTRVGCARAISSGPKGGIYLVCNYDPPGNFLGENAQNVLPASSKRVATVKPATSTTVAPSVTKPPVVALTTTSTTTTTTAAATTTSSTTPAPSSSAKPKAPKKKGKKKKKAKGKKKNKKNKNKNKKNKKKPTTSTSSSSTTTTSTTTAAPAVSSRRSG